MLSGDELALLAEDLAKFTHDPLGYVLWCFPWGVAGTDLEHEKGPRKWQREVLIELGELVAQGKETGEAIQQATSSGHGIGKALAHGEPVLTPLGWRPIEAIAVGDEVISAAGTATRVVGVFPQGERELFRVTMDDGCSVLVDGDHQWLTHSRSERKHGKPPSVRTTREIASSLLFRNGPRSGLNHQLPSLAAVQHPTAVLPVEPYLFGAWLGDGDAHGRITGMAEEFDVLMAAGANLGRPGRRQGTAAVTRSALGIRSGLRALGVYGCRAHEKFIPECYLRADVRQRIALLQGLLDTDGHANGLGNVAFEVVSPRLADDTAELVRSLGGVVRRGEKIGSYGGKQCRRVHRLFISLPRGIEPMRIPRKASGYAPQWGHRNCDRTRRRHIASVTPDGRGPATCIAVEHPSHLFVTRDHIVTHNSALVAWCTRWAIATHEDARGIITANTDTQLRNKTWPELSKWHRLAMDRELFICTATSLYSADPGHEKTWRVDAVPWSENNTEAFAGLHNLGKRLIVVFDEASAIADKVWEVTEGALTDEGTELIWLVYGNPTQAIGRFRECFRKNRHRWKTRQIDSREVEGTNKVQLQKWVEDHGENSDFVKVRVRGMFPAQSAKQFISEKDVDEAFGKHVRLEQYNFAPIIITCDPAWEGDDELVIGMRQGLLFSILDILPKNDNDIAVANKLARYEDELKADAVAIDAGYGTGIVSAGRTMGRDWQLVWFASEPDDPGCVNKRAEMWKETRDWLKAGGAIPADQVLRDDLCAPQAVPRADGKILIEAKKDMKARGVKSPNRADALCLSFAFPVVKKHNGRAPRVVQTSYDWRTGLPK